MDKLEPQQVEELLAEFPEWTLNGDTLQRTFRFEDFVGAKGFVDRVANLAERLQHHPDIMIRFNKVTLTLTTHDAGGLTERDFEFARSTGELMTAS